MKNSIFLKPAQVFKKKPSLLGIIKIAIIILASFYLLGTFLPFYQGIDAYLYGIKAIDIANGSYEYTNEFLQNTDYKGFSFGPFINTIHGTLIPLGGFGIYGLAAFSYILGGNYALFYLGPIITILFLIISERVVTKLFGGFAGLVILIFLFSDTMIMYIGRQLLTDSLFSLLLILGCFFLINFLKEKKYSSILLCSCFLTAATFIRYNGIIFLPLEILIVFGFFVFDYIKTKKLNGELINLQKPNSNFLKLVSKNRIRKILKLTLHILGPWAIFFIFLFSFNSYFFGDPFTNYWEQKNDIETESVVSSYLMIDSNRLEAIEEYSSKLVPDQTNFLLQTISFNSVSLDQFLLSIISFSVLISALLISLYFKIYRKEIIVFILFILGLVLFYSSGPVVSHTGVTERYMYAAMALFYGIIGYLMYKGWNIDYQKVSIKYEKLISKSWKGFLIIIFASFLLVSLYDSSPIGSLFVKQKFEFKNPQVFADQYQSLLEDLPEKSMILRGKDRTIIWQYDAVKYNPFRAYIGLTNTWVNDEVKAEGIEIINEAIDMGYNVYVFKEKNKGDPSYYRYLESEHGLILKEDSETFCKLVRIENENLENSEQIKSDEICHSFALTWAKKVQNAKKILELASSLQAKDDTSGKVIGLKEACNTIESKIGLLYKQRLPIREDMQHLYDENCTPP